MLRIRVTGWLNDDGEVVARYDRLKQIQEMTAVFQRPRDGQYEGDMIGPVPSEVYLKSMGWECVKVDRAIVYVEEKVADGIAVPDGRATFSCDAEAASGTETDLMLATMNDASFRTNVIAASGAGLFKRLLAVFQEPSAVSIPAEQPSLESAKSA